VLLLLRLTTVALGINLLILLAVGTYDVHLGPLDLAATRLFKPFLYWSLALLATFAATRTTPDPPPDRPALSPQIYALTLLALTCAVYAPTWFANFQHVDWDHRHVSTAIGSQPWKIFGMGQEDGFYRPIGYLSLWVDWLLFRNWPPGFHIQNFLFHAANAFLVSRLALRFRTDAFTAQLAGALFVVLTCQFEVVIWPAARFDLLAAFLGMLALLTLGTIRSAIYFLLAILSKEAAFAVPVLSPFLPGVPRRTLVRSLAAFAVCLAIALVLRVMTYQSMGGYGRQFVLSFKTFTSWAMRAPSLPVMIVSEQDGVPGWVRIAMALTVVLLSALALRRTRAMNPIWLWLGLTYLAALPTLNIIGWIDPTAAHARYVYFPSVFISMVLASLIPRVGWAIAAMVLFSVVSFHNQSAFLDSMRFLEQGTHEAQARCNGCERVEVVDIPERYGAVLYFREEIAVWVRNALGKPVAMVSSPLPPKPQGTLRLCWYPAELRFAECTGAP
jgi:hypothetical protein